MCVTGGYWHHYCTCESESCGRHFLQTAEMTPSIFLYSVWSCQLFCTQSRLSLPPFCSCPSLIVRKQFLHSALPSPFLSGPLCYRHTHFLTFTVGQQIHPSYQQISPEPNEAGLEMHVPGSDGFVTEVKVPHAKPFVPPTISN